MYGVPSFALLIAILVFMVSGPLNLFSGQAFLNPLRLSLILLFVLYLPGFVWCWAVWPARKLAGVERQLLAVGLSLALVPLAMLPMTFMGWTLSWSLLFWLIMTLIIVGLAVGLFNRRRAERTASG